MIDARLPHLDLALDASVMAAVLAEECLDRRYEVRDCRIGHVRHKPGRNCLIGYELTLRDRDRDVEFAQILCGRVYGTGASEQRWKKALEQPLDAVATGSPVTHIARMGMVVWTFPNERKLRGLGVLMDEGALAAMLPRILDVAWVRSATPELVRYIPEHGCTVRIRVETPGDLRVLYAKAYVDDSGAATFARMRQIPGARPLAWENGLLWQEEVPGVQAALEASLAACARALARLHQTPVDGLPRSCSAGWEVTRTHADAAGLDFAGFDAVAAELTRRGVDPLPAATLHGDLHLKNFLLDGGEAALIDFDTLRSGDPLEDVGSFVASLIHQGAAAGRIQEFVDAYAANVPWPVTERALAWHTACSLIRERALRAITRRKGDTPVVFASLIAAAQDLLERTQTARDVMRRFEQVVRETPGEILDVHYKTYRKQKSWNKSHVTVCYRTAEGSIEVRRSGHETAGWTYPHDPVVPYIAGVEVLNYRPENRCTWRFESAYGKTYCDGRGLAVHQRLNALWALSDGGGPAFPMPEPLGYTAALKTVRQAAYPGGPLMERLNEPQLLRAAAARLVFLHESGIECPQRATLAAQLADVEKKMAKLAVVLPAMEPRLRRMVEQLAGAMPRLAAAPNRVVHGDFHLRQLMVHGNDVALFDFDELGYGDPVEDFGHFAADLEGYGFPAAQSAYLNAVLLEGYEQAAGWRIPEDRLAWHVTVQLLTRAYRALLQLKPDFEARVERLVTLAEARQ